MKTFNAEDFKVYIVQIFEDWLQAQNPICAACSKPILQTHGFKIRHSEPIYDLSDEKFYWIAHMNCEHPHIIPLSGFSGKIVTCAHEDFGKPEIIKASDLVEPDLKHRQPFSYFNPKKD